MISAQIDEIIEHVINANMLNMPYDVYLDLFDAVDGLGVEMEKLEAENDKLRELAFGMYGLLEMFDKMLGNHDACETPRPLVFGEDKSFKDVMQDLGIEVD